MKINLDKQFKNLNGTEMDKFTIDNKIIEGHHLAKCFASCLWFANHNSMKFKLWAEDLYRKGEMEIDTVDIDVLIAWLEIYGTNPQIPYNQWFAQVGIKGQVIDEIKRQRDRSTAKDVLIEEKQLNWKAHRKQKTNA